MSINCMMCFTPGTLGVKGSLLTVSHDRYGIAVTYTGYVVLLLSMILFFFGRHYVKIKIQSSTFYTKFAHDFGAVLSHFRKTVKRESGESPEQTRCCKLRQSLWTILNTTVHQMMDGKGVSKME